MGFRWRVRVFPGVRLNVTKKGVVSTSVGAGPLTVNFSKRGVTSIASLPGTGLSYVHRHKGRRERLSEPPPQLRPMIPAHTVRPSRARGIWVGVGIFAFGLLVAGLSLIRGNAPSIASSPTAAGTSLTTPAPLPPRRPSSPSD
ncbi:DUF4236 domain-containing protein [Microvirga sp. HBU67558]|uniref:DUF4236 domain-containing protein n=1 Tax=Microvirga sp. HBU67558 TaxID=2824562 RepID=UPI001B394E74|nr:DUF4236 domain-containing protein [Microvirga sp. HBU67558]